MGIVYDKKAKEQVRKCGDSAKGKAVRLGKKAHIFSANVHYNPTYKRLDGAIYLPPGESLPDVNQFFLDLLVGREPSRRTRRTRSTHPRPAVTKVNETVIVAGKGGIESSGEGNDTDAQSTVDNDYVLLDSDGGAESTSNQDDNATNMGGPTSPSSTPQFAKDDELMADIFQDEDEDMRNGAGFGLESGADDWTVLNLQPLLESDIIHDAPSEKQASRDGGTRKQRLLRAREIWRETAGTEAAARSGKTDEPGGMVKELSLVKEFVLRPKRSVQKERLHPPTLLLAMDLWRASARNPPGQSGEGNAADIKGALRYPKHLVN